MDKGVSVLKVHWKSKTLHSETSCAKQEKIKQTFRFRLQFNEFTCECSIH